MANFKISNISIEGISACVPPDVELTTDISFYSQEEAVSIVDTTGIVQKHVAKGGITASDLCLKAARLLINKLEWDPQSIDVICFVTQTPDFLNHPDGFVIHEKLGLSPDCIVLDLFHGCPGWVIGLSTLGSYMSSSGLKRGLLLAGDVLTTINYPLSRENRPLFGDAGTVTALSFNPNKSDLHFDIGTDSKNGKSLIRKRGRAREPFTPETFLIDYELLKGLRSAEEIDEAMDGMSVFAFGISKPPKSIKKLIEITGKDIGGIDKFVFHQANKMMVDRIAKKLKIPSDKVPNGIRNYGNTASASIPLTIVSECRNDYENNKLVTIACGFGTGLSWASVLFETSNIICPPVITY